MFATKSIERIQAEQLGQGERTLQRVLGPGQLIMLGVGAIIGTGIFVLTGQAAAANAGPAIVLSMILAGLTSVLAALCYSEFAASVPVAGSAYTYAYATLGEFIAWVIGWDLILEYALGAATVAVGWSGNLVTLLHQLGVSFPAAFSAAPGTVVQVANLAIENETNGHDATDHLAAVHAHGGRVDVFMYDPEHGLAVDEAAVRGMGARLAPAPIARADGTGHDPVRLAKALAALG
jgi:hypothetical protein